MTHNLQTGHYLFPKGRSSLSTVAKQEIAAYQLLAQAKNKKH